MKAKIQPLVLVCSALLSACSTTNYENKTVDTEMLISGIDTSLTAKQYEVLCDKVLSQARLDFKRLENSTGKATMESVFAPYDKISENLQSIRQSWYIKSVHPDKSVREAATQCSQDYSDFSTLTSMSRGFYDRVAAIDSHKLKAEEKFLLQKTLRDFKQSGVDQDEITREKIRVLRQEITEIGNEFNKNIREDVRYVNTRVEELAGLPQDYIDARKPNKEGMIKISTDYPDLFPVMTYGENDELRRQLRVASRSRGFPANEQVLKNLISKRHELAKLLGYPNWASLSMDDKMIGDPQRAQSFLSDVGNALQKPMKKEMGTLLKRLQKIDPAATEVQVWQMGYLTNLIRQEDYALDSKEVREYFQYDKVRDGIFKLTEDLFGVTIRPWKTSTWHSEVETYEMLENGKVIGRFYMDNHPRTDKYKHAAHWGLRTGIRDKQIPLSGLAQNFPKGLMEHGQVETFLHEFGHLLHNMFSGSQKWYGIAGMSMERDFVEAPSQMLEEWIWDYDTLKAFAVNDKGEVIPEALVEKMNRARYFGQATSTATQIFYANLSLSYYDREPGSFELMPMMKQLQEQYAPYPYVEGTSFYTNFGHLNGYSSNYYTYQWSLAIATALFSEFEQKGLRNTQVSAEYRRKVLGAAGSKPAKEFVEEFLGRDFTIDPYIQKLKNSQ